MPKSSQKPAASQNGQADITKLNIDPVFGYPLEDDGQWPDVFVLMPLAKEFDPIYEDHILPVVQKFTTKCKRADNFFTQRVIIEEIWTAIYRSKICIADCTGRNPNVFYELGIAHT